MAGERADPNEVGPVLLSGRVAEAIVGAIREQNPGARVASRGSYLRVSVPLRCEVARRAIESRLGEPFRFPQDLERVMPSFRGRLTLSDDLAAWALHAAPPPAGTD